MIYDLHLHRIARHLRNDQPAHESTGGRTNIISTPSVKSAAHYLPAFSVSAQVASEKGIAVGIHSGKLDEYSGICAAVVVGVDCIANRRFKLNVEHVLHPHVVHC